MQLSSYIDHTNLKATATTADIKRLCEEAKQHSFKAVCVNGKYVPHAVQSLAGSEVEVATVVGFPLGSMTSKAKVLETMDVLELGVTEVDMVIHVPTLIAGDFEKVGKEIAVIKSVCKEVPLKVIIETCYLSDVDITNACKIIMDYGGDFVKTSTGFGSAGATIEHVQLMKSIVKDEIKIKASGGIGSRQEAEAMIKAGADRLGMSRSVKVVTS